MEKDALPAEALALPEKIRAEVASKLLESLEANRNPISDEEALAEATERSAEMDRDPSCILAHEEFLNQFPDRRK
jgi:hypothetical protein